MAHGLEESPAESFGEALEETAASVSGSALSLAGSLPLPVTGTLYQLQQLEDFDFLMKHFTAYIPLPQQAAICLTVRHF